MKNFFGEIFSQYIGSRNIPLLLVVVLYFCSLIFFKILIGKNDIEHFLVIEKIPSGKLVVKKDPGHFFKGIHKVYKWKWSNAIWFSKESDEGKRKDESVAVRYLDGALGNVSGIMVYEFDYNTPDQSFIDHHQSYNNQANFEDRVIKPMNMDALKIPASLMSSEESYTTRKKEYGEMSLDQIEKGILRTYIARDTVIDFTGEKVVGDVTKVLLDSQGLPVRSVEKSLSSLNISVPVFSLYEPEYQEIVQTTIARKRKQEMDRIISYASQQLEQRKDRMERINGEVNIINQKYEQEVLNMVEVTKADMRRDTMRIKSETRWAVSRVKEGIARTRKKIEVMEGDKELQIRNLAVRADNQLEDRINAYVYAQQQKADAFAKGKQIMPEFKLSSGASVNGAWDMFLYNQARPAESKK